MDCCVEDTGPITGRPWLLCRFMQHGCDWQGARVAPGLEDQAEEVRDIHERYCRFRFIANL